jgi:hypothetical protein
MTPYMQIMCGTHADACTHMTTMNVLRMPRMFALRCNRQ